MASVTALKFAAGLLARIPGSDLDDACGRVAAEERSLRPFQHFYGGNTAEREESRWRRPDIGVVEIDGDRRFKAGRKIGGAHAADEGRRAIARGRMEIGRASCRERGGTYV